MVFQNLSSKITLKYKDGYPPTVNDEFSTKKVLDAATSIVGEGAKSPYLSMGGRFFLLSAEKARLFFFIGSVQTRKNYYQLLIIALTLISMKGHYL